MKSPNWLEKQCDPEIRHVPLTLGGCGVMPSTPPLSASPPPPTPTLEKMLEGRCSHVWTCFAFLFEEMGNVETPSGENLSVVYEIKQK